jgi:hypothetical protein
VPLCCGCCAVFFVNTGVSNGTASSRLVLATTRGGGRCGSCSEDVGSGCGRLPCSGSRGRLAALLATGEVALEPLVEYAALRNSASRDDTSRNDKERL